MHERSNPNVQFVPMREGLKCWRRISRILMLCVMFTASLSGHAILLSAAPAANQVVSGPDISVQLRFNSRIDAKRSRLALVSMDGQQIALMIEPQSTPETLRADAKGLKHGSYRLHWQVLASDGHISRGEIQFQVQ